LIFEQLKTKEIPHVLRRSPDGLFRYAFFCSEAKHKGLHRKDPARYARFSPVPTHSPSVRVGSSSIAKGYFRPVSGTTPYADDTAGDVI
jgi:hypothetical protein